jgi:hypothetical protein
MTRITAIGILIVAAGLEAGGDALMRVGLHTSALWQRLALFSVAGIVLFAYGWTVNAPPWDFRKAARPLCRLLLPFRSTNLMAFLQANSVRLSSSRRSLHRSGWHHHIPCEYLTMVASAWKVDVGGER